MEQVSKKIKEIEFSIKIQNKIFDLVKKYSWKKIFNLPKKRYCGYWKS
jgi:hypothetical protein